MASDTDGFLPSAAQRDALERDGYTIVPDALGPDFVAALSDDLVRLERELGITPADNTFEGRATVRIYNLLVHGPNFEAVPTHPAILPLVEYVLETHLDADASLLVPRAVRGLGKRQSLTQMLGQ